MAGGIFTTGSHPKALWPGVKDWFGASYNEHTEEYSQLFQIETSTQNFEEYPQLKGFGLAPVKTEGKSVSFVANSQGWIKRFVHIVIGLGYITTREEIEDGLYTKVSNQRATALAFAMRQTKENVHANVINRAFNSSYTGGDAKELIATDHPSDAGNYSNELDPAADISEDAIEDLCIMIMTAENNEGNKINLMPQSLHIPANLWYESNRILMSTLQNDTANNATNVLKSTNALPQGIKMNHYFTDTDAFFIKTNCPFGLISLKRRDIEFTKDNEFQTENAMAKATERYSCGWVDPLCLFGSSGA